MRWGGGKIKVVAALYIQTFVERTAITVYMTTGGDGENRTHKFLACRASAFPFGYTPNGAGERSRTPNLGRTRACSAI